jgi:acylaminoacyl-peptidase
VLLVFESANATAGDYFVAADVFQLEVASDPQVSPDGSKVVYVRNFKDIMSDRGRSNLWIVDIDGTHHQPLTSGVANFRQPRWSPDGERIAYIATQNGATQLHVRWMESGREAQITNLVEAPNNIVWSPDGSQIALTMIVPEKQKPLITMPEKPKGAKWAKPANVIDQLIYRADGRGFLRTAHTHLFVVPSDGGTPRQLTSGQFDHGSKPAWMASSDALIISANRHDNSELDPLNSDLHLISVKDGLVKTFTDRQGPDGNPVLSDKNEKLAYLGFDDRYEGFQITKLYVANADGSDSKLISGEFDRSISNPRWANDGRSLFFSYVDHGIGKIASISLDGEVKDLVANVGGVRLGRPYASGSYSVSGNGVIAYTGSDGDAPADIWIRNSRGKINRITALNEDLLAHKTLGSREELVWPSSFDERMIQGWLIKPPDFDPAKKYPLILEIHGGPFLAYGPNFAAEIQLYAAAGFVVLYANPRGSDGYGKEFGNLIDQNYPGEDYYDLMSGVDAAIARGFIDEKNLFVTGGSGGGTLSAWIIGKTSRFNAAVVAKPVISWISFALTADAYNGFYKYWLPGFPWDHFEEYWRRSPLSLVGKVITPTMLITGESDYRTPMSETEQYYQALKLREVDAVMVRIPDTSHSIAARPSNLISKVEHVLAWFKKYLSESSEVEH